MADHPPNEALALLNVGRFRLDRATSRIQLDPRAVKILGARATMSLEELLAMVGDQQQLVRRTLEGASAGGARFDCASVPIRRVDGTRGWVRLTGPFEVGPDPAMSVAGLVIDVTAEEQLRQRLLQAERLETLGQFSAGISHNFNNMLLVIQGCLHELSDRSVDGAVPESLVDAMEASRRASLMVQQLAEMTRPAAGPAHVARCELDRTVERVVRLTRRSLPEDIELVLVVHARSEVRSRPGALDQVLQNLILNARDALVSAGTPRPRIHVGVQRTEAFGDAWAEITVADNGPGLPQQVVEHLFEPFVTTKGNRGTGLGLASSASIVRQLEGFLTYRPKQGGGAEFLIQLPAVACPPAIAPVPQGEQSRSPDLRVLLLDDEPAIRRVLGRALPRYGIQVAGTASVEEALACLKADGGCDVMLLDRSALPGVCGGAVESLRKASPEAVALYFSGDGVPETELASVDGVVRKPIQMEALATRLRGAVDRGR